MTRRQGDVSIRPMHSANSLKNDPLMTDAATPAAIVEALKTRTFSVSTIWLWRER
jgi:hypothetical protein